MITIDKLKLQIGKYVSLHENIEAVYLFGSAATGKMRRTSDLDIAMMSTRQIDGFERISLETELSNLLHMDVDLVIFHQAQVLLQHQILKYGRLLYERDAKVRVQQETSARREYLETRFLFRELAV
jgi:predicted nucleotidyltransferase